MEQDRLSILENWAQTQAEDAPSGSREEAMWMQNELLASLVREMREHSKSLFALAEGLGILIDTLPRHE
jgi:hypothetical protein